MRSALSPLENWVRSALQDGGVVLPAFPMVAVRLVDALEQPDVEVHEVCELLRQDPSIASQVIRIANSAYYGAASPIVDIRGATMRLGFRETASVAMSAACRSLFTVEDRAELELFPEVWGRLWASALIGAYGARLIAIETKTGDPERVFLSALFRDIGSLLLLKLVASGLVHGRLRKQPHLEELGALLSSQHERLGGSYLRESRLPEYVVEVAEQHHAASPVLVYDTSGTHVIRVVDCLCNRLGVTLFADETSELTGDSSSEILGFDKERVDYFSLQIEALREELQDLT